jgi:hypothetical protein
MFVLWWSVGQVLKMIVLYWTEERGLLEGAGPGNVLCRGVALQSRE